MLRPQFQLHLTTKQREYTYFLTTAFLPTVMALRWHQVAWKVNLPASFVLTLIGKHLSDRWITPSTPPKSTDKKKTHHQRTHLSEARLVPFRPHDTLAVPTPSSILQASSSTVEELLQLVLPGESSVTTSPEGNVTLSDKRIERDVKSWLGKREEEMLTSEDIASLQIYVRYRSYPPEQRTAFRKELFKALAPSLEGKGETTIPWMTGYSGESLSLIYGEGDSIIIKGNSWRPWNLSINQQGQCKYEDYYITIENENHATLRPAQKNNKILTNYRGLKGEWVHEFDEEDSWKAQLTTTKELLNTGPAHLELLFFKLDQVVAFLQGEPARQADQVFTTCYELLNALASEAERQALTPHREREALVPAKDGPSDQTSFILGPIWSPVATSEDSTFNWIVTRSSTGQTTLQLQKQSTGRGMMGGTAERTVTLKTLGPNKLELEIYKAGANDLESYASSSVYVLERIREGVVQITPQKKETLSHCIPFILGMRQHHKERSSLQSMPEMEADADFILKVLTTIADIKMSPDTMLIDSSENRLVNLMGHSVPTDRMKLLSSQRQGGLGHPAVYYDAQRAEVHGPNSWQPLLTGAL